MRQLQDKYEVVQTNIYVSRVLWGTLLTGMLAVFFGQKYYVSKLILFLDVFVLFCILLVEARLILSLLDFQRILRRGSRVVIYSSLSGDTYKDSSNTLVISFTKYFVRNELIGYYSKSTKADSFSGFKYRIRIGR